jgi:hypothetical protein
VKYGHLFLAAAVLIALINFAIGGFSPGFMVLIPVFPFCLLALLPKSWTPVGAAETAGIVGAGTGAVISVLPVTALFAYDMITGWKGGADIGLGLLYLFLPLYSAVFVGLGYFVGEVITLKRRRDYRRLPELLSTLLLFAGAGFCCYFLFRLQGSYSLYSYYAESDPSAAELYEVDIGLYIVKAIGSLLVPLVLFLMVRKNRDHQNK